MTALILYSAANGDSEPAVIAGASMLVMLVLALGVVAINGLVTAWQHFVGRNK
jgi:hypothetical protein